MELLAKGQLSYLILNCLKDRDMYGLELIDEIKLRSGFDIKMPSLYSNINRMKSLNFLSTYLKESTKGPKCSYSSITEKGRDELLRLFEIFGEVENHSPVFEEKEEIKIQENKEEPSHIETKQKGNELVHFEDNNKYSDYFADIEEVEENSPQTAKQNILINKKEEIIQNDFIKEPVKEEKKEEIKAEKSNKNVAPLQEKVFSKNFDISNDYGKHNKQKSFVENQIQSDISTAPSLNNEQKSEKSIQEFKNALLHNKNQESAKIQNDKKEEKNPVRDDGRFITERLDSLPKSKRFESSKISSLITPNQESFLPAPSRNIHQDPNCSDVKAKIENLYAKTTTILEEKVDVNNFDFKNYNDLARYYENKDISFKIYKKFEIKTKHNTNKLIFFSNLITFSVFSLLCLAVFLIIDAFSVANPNTNFVFYTFTCIYFVYLLFTFYNFKNSVSKVPDSIMNFWLLGVYSFVGIGIVFCLNFILGMEVFNMIKYLSSIIIPSLFILSGCCLRHFIYIILLKKYWK